MEENEKEFDDVAGDIEAAIKELEGAKDVEESVTAEPSTEETVAVETASVSDVPPPPNSWGEATKSEWAKLPESVRAEVLKREQDIHKAITNQDGERLFGRDLKEVITPYLPQITAAGSTPAKTVQNLLNTAYQLQVGSPQTKAEIVKTIAQSYGVDLASIAGEAEYTDPTIAQLQQKIAQLEQAANPQFIKNQLQEEIGRVTIESEIKAFSSNPENVHFEKVKPLMVALLNTGQANGLKDAYDMACMANPEVRSMIEAKKMAEEQSKRKQEVEAKRRAASSVSGSPAISSARTQTNPKSSVEDDLRAAFDAFENKV